MKIISFAIATVLFSQVALAEPVAVKINLPAGVTLREVTNSTVVPLEGAEEQTCTAEITLPKFQFENTDAVSTAMKRLSRKWFKMGLRSVNEFLNSTADKETCQGDYFTSQQINLSYTFTAQYGNMVSMVVDHYGYSGGAHGYGGIDSVLLNFATGKEVPGSLDTFLKADEISTVLLLIENKLLQQEGFTMDFGWNEEKQNILKQGMKAMQNFYFTPKGITFFYNPYHIGPYAAGTIEAELSWDEIRKLKNDSDYSASLP